MCVKFKAGENHSITMVILWDMINRKFAKRARRQPESCIPYVQEIEEDLLRYATKLNASVARSRIKYQAPSIENLLPENVREREKRGSEMPCYAWVNQLKTRWKQETQTKDEFLFTDTVVNEFRATSSCKSSNKNHSYLVSDVTVILKPRYSFGR